MNAKSSSRGQTVPAVALALGAIAVVAVALVALVSRPAAAPAGGGASPSVPPVVSTPRPSAPPTSTPAPSSPAAPSPTADPAAPASILLESTSGHTVRLSIEDPWKALQGAVSGHPGDGMSVRWHDSIVEQVAPNVIRITWVAFPDDVKPNLGILDLDGARSVAIVQRGPVPNSDALGEDRVVVLTFAKAINAKTLDVKVIDDMIH
jgi:hypothetical protein